MRVVQLIDSLEAGGAERMAVNFANLMSEIPNVNSYLVASRKEGQLKNKVANNVTYFFIDRKSIFDVKAIFKFRSFLRTNNIEIIHAHSTTFLLAILTKIVLPKIKIIWHDHYGNRAKDNKHFYFLFFASYFFKAIVSVNEALKQWSIRKLNCEEVYFLPNFSLAENVVEKTKLKGEDGKRIVMLANLKEPKNHLNLLKGFHLSEGIDKGWTLHFVGKFFDDDYFDTIKKYIESNQLSEAVFLYGSCEDIPYVLSQAEIGVLASFYEGFPVTIVEYGMAKLAVLLSNTIKIAGLRDNEHCISFNPNDEKDISNSLNLLLSNQKQLELLKTNLSTLVLDRFSKNQIAIELINIYNK